MNRKNFKIILLIFMVLDHIGILVDPELAGWFHILSRFVAPGFAYLAVEGFRYTKDLKKYILRMYIAAGIMQLGNMGINLLLKSKDIYVFNNIFLTLALGLTALYCIEYIPSKIFKGLSVGAVIIASIFSEGGFVILPFMIFTYVFREKRVYQVLSYLGIGIILLLMTFVGDTGMSFKDNLMINNDFLFVTIIPFIYLYDHKPYKSTKFGQYFFYAFYPLHLWIIAFVKFFFFK